MVWVSCVLSQPAADVTNTFQPNLAMLNPAIDDILGKLEPMEGILLAE